MELYPNNPRSPLQVLLFNLNAKRWSKTISSFSLKIADDVFQYMVNKFPEDKVPETELLLFFTVFKNICLNDDVRIDYKKIPSQTKNMINCIKKTKAGTELHKQAFKFLTNLIANLMNYIPDSRNFQFFYDIYDMGKDFQNKKEYQGPAIYMNGVYYSFGTHKSMKSTVLEYIKKYYEKLMTPERARYNLKAIAQFIRGANWVPPIMQKEGRIIYSWRNRSDRAKNEYVPTVFGIITGAPANTFKTSQHELGRSLAQLGSNDFAQFMSLVFTKVFESKFAEPNPVALCILGRIILSPRSEFLEHVPEAKTHIQIIIQNLSMMAFGVIRKVDTVKTSKAYSTSSFAAMLTSQISTTRKSSYADRLASAIYELPTYLSVPPLRADFPRKFPSSVTGKWNTIGSKRIVDEYFAAMGDVPFVIAEAKDEVNNEAQVQALSILPYLNPDMAALENIFDACLCSTVIRGRVALNALTALLLINHTNLTPFLTKFVAVSIVSQELHYQVLRVISTMLKSAMIIHLAHEDAILDVLFPFMLFSICSPVVTTRKLVWSIIEDLSIMTCGKTPNVLTTIQKNGTAISLGALNDLVQVSTILPSHEVTMIEPIPFQHVLESRYDCLYMFYLKHLGKIIAPEAASKMPFLLQSLGCVEGISKLFAANLSILITAISSKTSPLADTAGHIKQFEKYLLDIPGTPTLLPRVALYSSFDVPTILNYINMRYSSFSPELGDPYAFIVAHALTSTVRMLYKQQHDETYPLLNQFIQVLTSHMLALGISNKDLVFKFQAGPLENLDINLSMCNLNYIIERYFVELFENHHGPSESYYPLVQRFTGTIDKPIDPDELFHFLMNLNWVPKDEYELLKTTSARAFRVFTKCYSVPDNEHPTILKHLPNIQKNSDETFIYILSSSIHYYLPYYIEHVHKDPLYLRALADLFINPFDGDGFFNQWKAQAEIQYNDNIQITDQRLYTCTPQLLSIAFLNLVSHIPANRQYAFQLLNGIVFTSLFIHDRAFSSANLARLLYTIKTIVQSQQAELFEDLIIDLSAELRQQFGFCAERFIKTTFDLFKLHKKQFLFLGTVIPWIDKVVLQVKERQIIPETEEQFLSFTTYSFVFQILTDIISLPLQRQQLELIDVILEQQTGNDAINTTEAIFLLLFSIYSNHLDLEDKILGVIEYIVSRQPERMIPILLTFFSFKTELYGSLSTFYEIRVMLQEFKQEDNARVGNQSIIRHFLPLTCLIITKLLASNPDSLTQVIPVAAVLFFLRYNLDNEDTAKFSPKKMLPPLFEAVGKRNAWVTKHTDLPVDTLFQGEDKRLRNEVSIINQMIDFIYTLREEERIIAHDQLLQWGLICGDIVSSALALQLYLITEPKVTQDILNAVLKTLYNVISVTIETTNPDVSTTTSNIQAMDSIMIDNFESIYKEVRNYIRVLLNTVAYIQHKLEQKSMEAFNIAISLLKCVSKALNPIFSAALDILIYSFEDADFIDQFKSTPSELKILFLMMEAHSTESTHNKIFKLITILLDNDLSTLLSDHPVIILMTLIPFFWTQRFDASVQSALTKAANLCGEKTLVDELEGLRIHVAKDLVYRISNASLTTLVNHPGLPLLIQYYTQITEENHATIEIVLLIAERLMQHPKLEYSTLQLFAWIGRFATAPNPGTYLNPALEFIFKFAEKNGKIANEPFNMRHNTKFPQIKIDLSSDPRTWEPDPNVDPFLAPADFPPMGVQISSFTETEFQERICTHLLQLKIQPLAMWEEMTDSAIGHIPVMSSESASLQMPPKALLANTINTILNIADKPTVAFETLKKHETSRYSTHASRSRGSAEVRKPVEEKVVTTFDFSVFGPDDPSTTTIGNDLLTGIILFA